MAQKGCGWPGDLRAFGKGLGSAGLVDERQPAGEPRSARMSKRAMGMLDGPDAEAFRVMEELVAVARATSARIRLTEGLLRTEARVTIQEAREHHGRSAAAVLEFRLDQFELELWARMDALRRAAFERLAEVAEARLPGGGELLAELLEGQEGPGIRCEGAHDGKAKGPNVTEQSRNRKSPAERKRPAQW